MELDAFILASWIGTVAFALSGFVVGVRQHLDIMGIFILSFLTANGGGIIRDVFIGHVPFVLTDITGFVIVCLTFLVGLILYRFKILEFENRGVFVLSDSVGLVAFSVTGALAALDAGLHIFGVMVLSFVTAVGGGMLRDVIVRETPAVLKSDFYGSVALIVAVMIYGLAYFSYLDNVSIFVVFLLAMILRLLAFKMKWSLPTLRF